MLRYRRIVALLLLWLAALPALAQAPDAARPPANHITAELVVAESAMPGGTALLAIHMRPDTGWHGYWANPGDAGLGMSTEWTLPPGFTAGALRYPVPQTLLIGGLMNHVFEHDYAVLVPLTIPADARAGSVIALRVAAQWLACTDTICVPEQGVLTASLPIRSDVIDARRDAWQRALPAPLGAPAHFAETADGLRLGIPLPASVKLDHPHVFIMTERAVDYAAPQEFERQGDLLIVTLARAKIAAVRPETVNGVLRLGVDDSGLEVRATPGPVPEPRNQAIPALGWLLLAALAGGLLLNVMPCVFPILSLKALSLARAGESEAQARAEGVAYSAGVIVACLALGALLLVLRAGGAEVGWAFQLQEPAVVALLALLAVAITANLAGLFELAVPGFAGTGSRKGAFATGLLAAFVATPCTGPFMAGAMGAALLLPVGPALALFAALGLGIALPFLAIAFIPALRRRLPRPGAWMATLRRILALPMALTALALLWLAWRLGGAGFAVALAGVLLALIALLWTAGRRQRRGESTGGVLIAGMALLTIAAPLLTPLVVAPSSGRTEGVLPTKPFSQSALDEARAAGKPVFVWMTADWCLTCKVNESVAIEREAVRDAFARAGVVVLKGDWTRRDPAITRYLTAQGAAGVPLYVWYPANGDAPSQLPQVLGPDSLIALVKH